MLKVVSFLLFPLLFQFIVAFLYFNLIMITVLVIVSNIYLLNFAPTFLGQLLNVDILWLAHDVTDF